MKSSNFIKKAFYSLCMSKKMNEISVNAIINKARVNRSTFYYYYENKEDMMEQLRNEVIDNFSNILLCKEDLKSSVLERFGHYSAPQVYAICHHIEENKNLFKIWLNDEKFVEKLLALIVGYSKKYSNDEIHCIYAAHGTIGYFNYWVQNDCLESPNNIATSVLNLFQNVFILQKVYR